MLFYKAWLETRARFLVSFGGILTLCSWLVYHDDWHAEPWASVRYYNYVLTSNQAVCAVLCVLIVALLMMGGLVREHAIGSLPFTLALPVGRRRLMGVRIALGLAQAFALSVIPSCAMYAIASLVGKAYSLNQLAFHLVILLAGGSVFFAISVLVSVVVEGEYTAPAVSLGLALAIGLGLESAKLKPFNPLRFMMGSEYRNVATELLSGPIPWLSAVLWLTTAAALLLIAVELVRRRDF